MSHTRARRRQHRAQLDRLLPDTRRRAGLDERLWDASRARSEATRNALLAEIDAAVGDPRTLTALRDRVADVDVSERHRLELAQRLRDRGLPVGARIDPDRRVVVLVGADEDEALS